MRALLHDSPANWPKDIFQRGLALVYLIAFLVAVNQFVPLLGEHGLLPVPIFVRRVAFWKSPSLFYFIPRDAAFTAAAWTGVALSCVAMAGIADRVYALLWGALWVIYLSFVNVGQTFYGFGWESMLLEAGFYAIFLGGRNVAPSRILMWMLRWMEFRVMFGAGLIKLRGDPCWRNLTCLDYFYETQPMPNPLSWYFHFAPEWMHKGGVVFNHFVELAVPWGFFAPQPVATIAAAITILFQALLMLGGNLSFLNVLTIVLAIPAIDAKWVRRQIGDAAPYSRARQWVVAGLAIVVGFLSIEPALNLISPGQIMNTNYNPLQLVNTYGAFGGITRTRYEVIVEGSDDGVTWREYEFKGKPGDPMRQPPQVAPYHLRLDWLMWFAAMSQYSEEPWFVNFAAKLLEGDNAVLGLLRGNPFPHGPPKTVRALLYHYRFSTGAERRATGAWWVRERVGVWFPEVSLDTPGFRELLKDEGWM